MGDKNGMNGENGGELNVGDRVRRKGIPGPQGTVQQYRVERVRSSIRETKSEDEGPSVMVSVLWDNGTLSHFVPDGLEKI